MSSAKRRLDGGRRGVVLYFGGTAEGERVEEMKGEETMALSWRRAAGARPEGGARGGRWL